MPHARHTIFGVRSRRLSTRPEEALISSSAADSSRRAWRTADDVATGSVATEGRRGLAGPLISGRYVSSRRGCEEGATTRAMCPERLVGRAHRGSATSASPLPARRSGDRWIARWRCFRIAAPVGHMICSSRPGHSTNIGSAGSAYRCAFSTIPGDKMSPRATARRVSAFSSMVVTAKRFCSS